jgi:hypothetical protein
MAQQQAELLDKYLKIWLVAPWLSAVGLALPNVLPGWLAAMCLL